MARDSLKGVMRLIDAVKEELPVEKMFLKDLEYSIEKEDMKSYRLPSQTYKPSGMKCIRAMYYQIMGKEQDNTASKYTMIGICNSGSDIHQRIQDSVLHMKDNNIDCEYVNVADFVRERNLDYLDIVKEPNPDAGDYETKLYHKDLNMSFLCDGIVRYKGKYYILEIKTEASFKWQNRSDVDPNHYNQGTAYSLALGINEVLFVYINRDVLDMKAFMFNVTDEMRMNIIGKIEECDGYVKHMITPPKPEYADKRMCTYCDYRERCKSE